MKLLEKKRDELADAHTSSTYFHLEYSTSGKTAKECNNSFREGFNAAIKELEPIFLQAIEEVKSWYPVAVFPEEDTSQVAMSARACRLTCDNILKEYKIKTGGE